MKENNPKGFTLVELLIVIAILGILMGLALAGMRFAQRRARDLQRQNAVRNLSSALESYYVDYRVYPAGSTTVETLVEGSGSEEYLSEYLENTFELPQGTSYSDIGYVTTSDNLSYLVCILPENVEGATATTDDLMTSGTDSSLDGSCLAEIAGS